MKYSASFHIDEFKNCIGIKDMMIAIVALNNHFSLLFLNIYKNNVLFKLFLFNYIFVFLLCFSLILISNK